MDDDPLNAPEFDPVAYLNHHFPSGKPHAQDKTSGVIDLGISVQRHQVSQCSAWGGRRQRWQCAGRRLPVEARSRRLSAVGCRGIGMSRYRIRIAIGERRVIPVGTFATAVASEARFTNEETPPRVPLFRVVPLRRQ